MCGCGCMSSRMEFLLKNEPLRIGGAHMITLKSSPDIIPVCIIYLKFPTGNLIEKKKNFITIYDSSFGEFKTFLNL